MFVFDENVDLLSYSQRPTKKKRKKNKFVFFISLFLTLALVLVSSGLIYINSLLNTAKKVDLDINELGITENVFKNKDVINIALFGIDTRTDSTTGRSDAVMIVSVDKKHNKIKLTSIARDSYVNIEGTGMDKLTHAYAYGGAKLAVKTINQNFDMNITDYVSVNFFGIVNIIDEIGGVTIDVDGDEMAVMNTEYVTELNRIGIPCDPIVKTGSQRLTGAQALAYMRNRYTGGDLSRANRQQEVISALFGEVKNISITKYPSIIKMGLSHVETTLTNTEILSLAVDVVTNSSTIDRLSLPTDDCNPKSGKDAYVNGVWYYIYDIDIAKNELHDFIKETGKYEVAKQDE